MVDFLIKQGLVKRQTDRKNRRSNQIIITEKGIELRNRLLPVYNERKKNLLKDITEDELFACKNVLNKMINNID